MQVCGSHGVSAVSLEAKVSAVMESRTRGSGELSDISGALTASPQASASQMPFHRITEDQAWSGACAEL